MRLRGWLCIGFCSALLASWAAPASAQLAIAIEAPRDTVKPGQLINAEVTVTNTGGGAVANVSVQLDLPTPMVGASQNYSTGGGTCTGSGNANTNCDAGETITWVLGTLPGGARKTVSMIAIVPGSTSTPPNGTVLSFAARVLEGAVVRASAAETSTVQAAPTFDLAADDAVDAVAPGASLTYTLSYANVSGANAAGATLAFALAAGTSFVSASGGGSFGAGVVTWNLGTLAPAQGGTREVTVSVGAGLAEGTLLRPVVQIQGPGLITARATPVSAVQSGVPLRVEFATGTNPARNGEWSETLVTVTNVGGPVVDPVLEVRLDQIEAPFSQNLTTRGAICTVSGAGNTNCDGSERVQWDLPPLAAGERITVSFPMASLGSTSSPPNGTLMTVRAEAFEPLAGQIGESALARQTVRVDYARTFELAIDASDDPVAPGAPLSYTLSYANTGAGTSTGAVLAVPLPPGTTFVSASDGGALSAGVVTWSLGTLAPGQGGTRQLDVNVLGSVAEAELLKTVAQIGDAAANAARAPSVVVVQSGSPLRVEIETGPNPTRNGEWGEALITVTNVGGGPIDGVLELRLDDEEAPFSQNYTTHNGDCTVSGSGNANCDANERLLWDLPTLASGERITVSTILAPFGSTSSPPNGTQMAVRAEVYEPLVGATGESRIARQTLRVQYSRTFELDLDPSDDPVAPGASLTYTATFANASAANTTGTTLSVPVPAGTTFVSATNGGVLSSGAVTWNLGTLVPGQGGTRQFTVNVNGPLPQGEILRTAAKISDAAANAARALSTAVVQSGSPLRVEIQPRPNPARNGEWGETLITVTNVGGASFDGVLELRLDDEEASFSQSYTSGNGNCTVSGSGNANCDANERLQWDLPPLAAGERVTVSTLIAPQGSTSSPPNGTLMPLRAEVYEPVAPAAGPGRSRLARQTLRVQYPRTYELTLDASDDPVAQNADLTYTATFSNIGSTATSGTTLSVPVPAGTTFVSANGGGVLSSGVVTWNLGALPASQAQTRQLVVNVGAGLAQGDIVRTEAQLLDAAGNAARAASATVVQAGSPVRVEIETGANPARNGEWTDAQVTVTNVSGSTYDGTLEVRLDDYAASFTQTLLTRGGICTAAGGNTNCDANERAQWDLPPLAQGERTTVSFLWAPFGSTSSPPNGTLMSLRAQVDEQGVVGAPGRSRIARTQTAVQYSPTFELALDESADPVAPDTDLTYTITLGRVNAALSALPVLSFQVPAGTTFVSATGGGTHNAGLVTWNLPPLPAGQTGTRQVTVHVGAGLALGTQLRALAQITDIAGYSGRARAVTAVQSGAGAPLRLSVSATPDPARPANVLDVQLQVQNLSGSTVSGALLEARLPNWVAFFAQTATTGGGICTISGNLNTNCDANDRAQWALPDIPPGGATVVSMPPTVLGSTSSPANGTLLRFDAWVDDGAPQSVAKETVRVGFLDSDGDGLLDTFDNCGAVANADQADGDADESGDVCDLCPTITNGNQSDVDGDLVGDVCDNCVTVANPRVAANFLATNTWATLTGGQRDDDHDGYGNRCDAKFPGVTGALVGSGDLTQFRASNGKSRTGDTCGTTGTRPCAIYDLDEAASLIGAADLAVFRTLNGKAPGPKCAACPLACTAGTTGTCN